MITAEWSRTGVLVVREVGPKTGDIFGEVNVYMDPASFTVTVGDGGPILGVDLNQMVSMIYYNLKMSRHAENYINRYMERYPNRPLGAAVFCKWSEL